MIVVCYKKGTLIKTSREYYIIISRENFGNEKKQGSMTSMINTFWDKLCKQDLKQMGFQAIVIPLPGGYEVPKNSERD